MSCNIKRLITLILFLLTSVQSTVAFSTQSINSYFHKIKNNPKKLAVFIERMPKGGILHLHLAGSVYAEDLIKFSAGQNYCLANGNSTITKDCKKHSTLIGKVITNKLTYNKLIDAWSVKKLNKNKDPEIHFYNTFSKYYPIIQSHSDYLLEKTVERAYADNILYLEIMYSPETEIINQYAKPLVYIDNLELLYQRIKTKHFNEIVTQTYKKLIFNLSLMKKHLNCTKYHKDPACNITIRFQYQVNRDLSLSQVFAQMIMGFDLVDRYPEYVGVNLVGREYSNNGLKNYDIHMKMLSFLHKKHPNVKLSLHAGETNPNLSKKIFGEHIAKASIIANRIGHGTNILKNSSPQSTIQLLMKRNIAIEINLTSNQNLLNVYGKTSPLLFYLENNVPIILSTDDPGILRTNINKEFMLAITNYNLTYAQIKQIVRNSLIYSFLPGKSLWIGPGTIAKQCKEEHIGDHMPGKICSDFLGHSFKAQIQWELEKKITEFEKHIH